jgi:hypothetical protein
MPLATPANLRCAVMRLVLMSPLDGQGHEHQQTEQAEHRLGNVVAVADASHKKIFAGWS